MHVYGASYDAQPVMHSFFKLDRFAYLDVSASNA